MAPTRIPGITYAAAPRAEAVAAALGWNPRIVVVHDTGNPSADRFDEAHYAATRTDPSRYWTSCHAYIDDGGVLGSLRLDRQAWAAYSYANRYGLHVEMCGMNAGDPHAVPAATITRTAALVRQLCELADIPMVKLSPAEVAAGKRGVCGHLDVTIGLGVGTHEDPGPRFDWPDFMRQINQQATAPTPAPTGDDEMSALVQVIGHPAVFRTNGVHAYWIKDETQLSHEITLQRDGTFGTDPVRTGAEWYQGAVRLVNDYRLVGVIVGDVPANWPPPLPIVAPIAGH